MKLVKRKLNISERVIKKQLKQLKKEFSITDNTLTQLQMATNTWTGSIFETGKVLGILFTDEKQYAKEYYQAVQKNDFDKMEEILRALAEKYPELKNLRKRFGIQ